MKNKTTPYTCSANRSKICRSCGANAKGNHFTVKCPTIAPFVLKSVPGEYDALELSRLIMASTRTAIASDPMIASREISSWEISLAVEKIAECGELQGKWWEDYGVTVVAPVLNILKTTDSPDNSRIQVPPSPTDVAMAEEARLLREQTPDRDECVCFSSSDEDQLQRDSTKKRALEDPVICSPSKMVCVDGQQSTVPSIVTPSASILTGREATTKEMKSTSSSQASFISLVDVNTLVKFDKDTQHMIITANIEVQKLEVERRKLEVESQKLNVENRKLRIEECKLSNKQEMQAKADVAKAELIKAQTAKCEALVTSRSATRTMHTIKSVTLSQIVRAKLVKPEVARIFTRLMPFDRIPMEWLPKMRNIPKNNRDNGMTRDIVFNTSSIQEVADVINNIATGSNYANESMISATPTTTPMAQESPIVVNINNKNNTTVNAANTINQALQPLPPSRFAIRTSSTNKNQSMGLMDTLRNGVKGGEKPPVEWSADYYSAWLGHSIAGKVPFQLKANKKVYLPEHQHTLRQLEAQFRKEEWPHCKGRVPSWCTR